MNSPTIECRAIDNVQRPERLKVVVDLIVLVGEDDTVRLGVSPPLVEPLRRVLLVPPPILDDSLLQRLALFRDLVVPLSFGSFDQGEDRMRCRRFVERVERFDDHVSVRVELVW